MIAASEGNVVATPLKAGMLPVWIPYHTPCSAAKAGILGLMPSPRDELARPGRTALCFAAVVSRLA